MVSGECLDARIKTGGSPQQGPQEDGIRWNEVQKAAAEDRRSWWNHVDQCIFDAG